MNSNKAIVWPILQTRKLTMPLIQMATISVAYHHCEYLFQSCSLRRSNSALFPYSICIFRSSAIALLRIFACKIRGMVLDFSLFATLLGKPGTTWNHEHKLYRLPIVRNPCKEHSIFSICKALLCARVWNT